MSMNEFHSHIVSKIYVVVMNICFRTIDLSNHTQWWRPEHDFVRGTMDGERRELGGQLRTQWESVNGCLNLSSVH